MKLTEYQSKELFKKYNIPVPLSVLMEKQKFSLAKLKQLPDNLVVKAQVLTGGRGKSGGILKGTKKDAPGLCKLLFSKKIKGLAVKEVLVEEQISFQKEFYLSLTIDRFFKNYVLLFSTKGGINIEQLYAEHHRSIKKVHFVTFNEKRIKNIFPSTHQKQLLVIAKNMFVLMQKEDALLVEINPLVKSKKKLVATDAKVIIDSNALFRHTQYKTTTSDLTVLEKKADKLGLQYVELEGNVAVIGNGAGLVMASLDTLSLLGGKPASFFDVGGGTGAYTMEKALTISLQKKGLKGIFINILAGITRCDEIAEGIVRYKKKHNIKLPVVVRMIGTHEKKGRATLEKNGIHAMQSMEKAAREIIQLSGK